MPPVENLEAFGPAWFVDSFVPAGTPDEEIALIDSVDLRHTAVIGSDFTEAREGFAKISSGGSDEDPLDVSEEISVSGTAKDVIQMTSYAPNELRYHYSASAARTAIFSEIYYPDGGPQRWMALRWICSVPIGFSVPPIFRPENTTL